VEEAKSAVDDEVRSRQKLTSENRQLQVSAGSNGSSSSSMYVCMYVY